MQLRISKPKDAIAGSLFLAIGGAAWLGSQDFQIGTATRMGPGYFPQCLGLLLMLLGAASLLRALGTDPAEPAEARALTPLLLILAGVIGFYLLIDRAGLVAAIFVLLVVRLRAPTHQPAAGGSADLRSAGGVCRRRVHRRLRHAVPRVLSITHHGPAAQSRARLRHRAHAGEYLLLPGRRHARHAGRRAAGAESDPGDHHAAAADLQDAGDRRADHAVRHLLRRAPCRLDHRDHAEHAGRAVLGGDLPRRPSDGTRRAAPDRRCAFRPWARSSPAASACC